MDTEVHRARYPRLFLTGYPHHIVQRGHDRKPVFIEDGDYQRYLDNLRELKALLDIRVYGFCLMTNHVHLLLEPRGDGSTLSSLMKRLAARQTRYVNRLERRTGTLWEGRFKCSVVDEEGYLLACQRYIDLNPVRAALVAEPGAYRWSSYRALTGRDHLPWLDEHSALQALVSGTHDWRAGYARFVAAATTDRELARIRDAIQRNQLTGDTRFTQAIEARFGRRVEFRGPGRPKK